MGHLLIPDADKKRHKNVDELMQSEEYKELKKKFNKQMKDNLKIKNGQYKTKKDLYIECTSFTHKIEECQSMKRLIILSKAHHSLMQSHDLLQKVPTEPLIDFNHVYEYQQVINDFLHVKFHMDQKQKLASKICEVFEKEIKCKELESCIEFQREHRVRNDSHVNEIYFRQARSKTC